MELAAEPEKQRVSFIKILNGFPEDVKPEGEETINEESKMPELTKNEETKEDKRRHKEMRDAMEKMRLKTLQKEPFYSSDFFNELNIENLALMYWKCKKEFNDTQKFFNITDEKTKEYVLQDREQQGKSKHQLREIFEEILFYHKVSA